MSIAITEEQRAVQQSLSDATARTDPIAAVRAMAAGEPDAWGRLWPELARIGLFSIALPEELGGAGCGLDDQCAALEQAAGALVPGPVLPTVLAGILLARQQDSPTAKELLPHLADGTGTAAVALSPGALTAAAHGDGILVSGAVEPVLGAKGSGHLLLVASGPGGEVWFALRPGQPGVTVTRLDGADPSQLVGRVTLDRVPVSGDRCLPWLSLSLVGDLAATLAAAEAAGVAGWCVRTSADYAAVRRQFGRPIGAFQAVKHLCAEQLCRAEQAAAVAWDAARAYPTDQHPLAAAGAAALALDAAVDNAKDCIQVLGGIGFTWEHDAHLYLRRAVALRQLLGGSSRWRLRAADLALGGARRHLELESHADEQRRAVRAFARDIAALPPERQRARLVESGYLVPHWPRPYGVDAAPRVQLMIDEELAAAGVRRPDLLIGNWAAATIARHGTQAQRDRFVPATLRGEIDWCQLFSEPEAGSDLAALRTRASRVDGGWRLSGQKVWTSRAREADWGICLARTDPGAPKHKGITYFLVDMRAAGLDIRPLREITGAERFNEVFLDGVFVPDDCVVGAVNDGWRLARATLADERVAMSGGSSLGAAVERLLTRLDDPDPVTRQRIGALVATGAAVSLVDFRATLRQLEGQDPGAESGLRKLIGVRHRQDVAEAALDLLGADGELLHEFLLTRCLSIAGGTSQILLNVIGERLLGLPRD
ncbi:MAG TPA: acyl-CoA dehydrogenase [Actinophytocola sp.]|uniref:acyl-CoA dehydrogenase n=1 Tax=Actinophytocola sp. TaxID=1872138 RepID=UPI002DDC9FD9|nr:acyl-CoA dehydrogenase [Actinophytocola sp.]HEV2781737.1 acyl-CoA dehydrogenase [Actinophytocola sp.]